MSDYLDRINQSSYEELVLKVMVAWVVVRCSWLKPDLSCHVWAITSLLFWGHSRNRHQFGFVYLGNKLIFLLGTFLGSIVE